MEARQRTQIPSGPDTIPGSLESPATFSGKPTSRDCCGGLMGPFWDLLGLPGTGWHPMLWPKVADSRWSSAKIGVAEMTQAIDLSLGLNPKRV